MTEYTLAGFWQPGYDDAAACVTLNAFRSRQNILDDARQAARQLLEVVENEAIPQTVEKAAAAITSANNDLKTIEVEIEQESHNKDLMDNLKENITDDEIEIIQFVDRLQIFEQTSHLTLGEYEAVVTDKDCYDMSVSAAGHLVVARVGGLDILDMTSGATINSIHFEEGKVGFVVETYKDLLIVGVATGTDSCDLAVVDNQVFISGADPASGNIKVFTLNGQQQPDIFWNGKTEGIASIPPCYISFGDISEKKIYKQQITDGKKGTTWSAPVPIPHCICMDQSGLIWVHSNSNDSITILSQHGDLLQEIQDDKLTKLGVIADLCVHEGYLYTSHHDGVGRFKIN
ncbi:hypothetical protein EB796_005039 [Bugula neritina]|uniref:Uncharacterized protein n=1 Tax=Bugula neritina TaxID=10212 RepID=A0A7J7KGN4_BUGNE|nr:hypothetical protein EB796_005039 [Bugula neritina]